MWVPKKDVNITFYRPLMTIIRVLHFELAGFSISFARRPRQRQQSSNTYALNTHRQPSNQPASIYFILLLFFFFSHFAILRFWESILYARIQIYKLRDKDLER